jgi:Lhr-like helicase
MNDKLFAIVVFSITSVFILSFIINDIKAFRRAAPYGKVFVRDFMEMLDDIETALTNSKEEYLEAFISGNFKFNVKVEKETPHIGLEYETIPMYKSYVVYIGDEVVCRAHVIRQLSKDHTFLEFSSKRKRDEVIDIVKKADKVARELNHESVVKWFSKYDSKSFYKDYSSSEDVH